MKRLFFLAWFLVAFSAAYSQDYQRAIGLRLGWDYGISYKQFIKGTHAIEGVATFRSWGVPGYRYSYFRITGLYLVHNPFPGVEGLQWYYGGGASISMYGGEYRDWVKSLDKDYGREYFNKCVTGLFQEIFSAKSLQMKQAFSAEKIYSHV